MSVPDGRIQEGSLARLPADLAQQTLSASPCVTRPARITLDAGKRGLMLASLRYLDTFVKMDGAWLFAERRLYVDWLEERALS